METLAWRRSHGGLLGRKQGEGEEAQVGNSLRSGCGWGRRRLRWCPAWRAGVRMGGETVVWGLVLGGAGRRDVRGGGEEGLLDRWGWGHWRRCPERSWRWGVKLAEGW